MRMGVNDRTYITTKDGVSLNHSIDWVDDYEGGYIKLFDVVGITDKEIVESINYINANEGHVNKYSGVIYFPSRESTLKFINKLEEFIKNR